MYARLCDDRTELFQWDSGIYFDVSADVKRIDFQIRSERGTVYGVFADDDGRVYVPDLLLQNHGIMDALIMIQREDGTVTIERREIAVIERPMPPGYVVTSRGSIITYDELNELVAGFDILPSTGGKMKGTLDMGGHKLTGLMDAENETDSVSKRFADMNYLKSSGGAMTGRITGLLPPIEDTEPVRKKEYDSLKEFDDKLRIMVMNVVVQPASFADDKTYETYPKRAAVPVNGVNASMFPIVVFPVQEDVRFAPVAHPYDGGVYIYADDVPGAAITIPTIYVWRGAE